MSAQRAPEPFSLVVGDILTPPMVYFEGLEHCVPLCTRDEWLQVLTTGQADRVFDLVHHYRPSTPFTLARLLNANGTDDLELGV